MKTQKNFLSVTLFLFTITIIIGCTGRKSGETSDVEPVKPYPHVINMTEGFQNTGQIKLSDIADSIRYIILSKDKQLLLGSIRSVQVTDNNIYLIADNLVMRFDHTGRFLNSFGSIGRGPQEYLRGSIYTTTPEDEKIIILRSAMYSYLSFKPDGDYIGTNDFPVPRTLYSFSCISDSAFLCTFYYVGSFMKDYIHNSIDLSAGLFDSEGNQKQAIEHPLKNEIISKNDITKVISSAPTYTFFHNRIVLSTSGDTIYEVDGKSITKGFIIDWGQISHMQSVQELYFVQAESANKAYFSGPLLETYRKAYFRVRKAKDYYIFEYDKSTGKVKSMLLNPDELGFVNDLDGGSNYYPYWTNRAGDTWIVSDDAYSFKEKHSDEFMATSNALYPEMKEKLKTFTKNLKQDDNPILKVVYLKNMKKK